MEDFIRKFAPLKGGPSLTRDTQPQPQAKKMRAAGMSGGDKWNLDEQECGEGRRPIGIQRKPHLSDNGS
jgi:hypothetical protein